MATFFPNTLIQSNTSIFRFYGHNKKISHYALTRQKMEIGLNGIFDASHKAVQCCLRVRWGIWAIRIFVCVHCVHMCVPFETDGRCNFGGNQILRRGKRNCSRTTLLSAPFNLASCTAELFIALSAVYF